MRMNIGIGKFYCFQKRNPQLFLKFTFFVDGVGEGMEKAGLLFVGLPLVYSVVYFSIIIVVYFSITIYIMAQNKHTNVPIFGCEAPFWIESAKR